MGMAASQMRYCMLSGRKSDVEFQGQQINQQRTTLATQTSAYNSQLLNLVVPTPPSTASYTTTAYTFTSNGQSRTVTGTVYDSTSGTYTVNYTTSETTDQGQSTGTSVFNNAGTPAAPQYQTGGGNALSLAVTAFGTPGYSAVDESNIALIAKDCKIPNGATAYGAPGYTIPPFYKYTIDGTTKYVLASELATNANTTTAISTYDVNKNAKVTTSAQMTGAAVTWSSSGRMSSITDSSGHEYSLNVSTTNDDAAYTNAYNEYQYKKSLYDQEINNINAKVSDVEAQDKKLELQLRNLDTTQQSISTEMDAVKKVTDKNIEVSFKTFA